VSGILVKRPSIAERSRLAGLGEKDTGEKEHAKRHERVGYDVVDRANHAGFVGQPNAADHVADFGDDEEGEDLSQTRL